MAYSRVTYPTPTEGQTLFSVTFPYLAQAHVLVAIDGVDTTAFTWATASTIELDTGVSAASTVQIRRETQRSSRIVDFEDAGMVSESMLDQSALQVIYIAQEALDIASEALTLDTTGAFDALDTVIHNVSDAVASGDAVNLGQLLAAEMGTLAPTAANITFAPAGTIAAATVQAAIEELDSEVNALITALDGATTASLALKAAKASNLSDLANLQTAADNLAAATSVDATPAPSDDYALTVKSGVVKRAALSAFVRYEEVRQTVVAGSVDSNGQANFLSAGTGLAVNLAATTTPVVVSFAAGEDESGPVNYRKRISADVASVVSSLAAHNRSYIYADRDTSTGALTFGKTLIPPQLGMIYNKAKQALLRFVGADTSTTILDDYGNTWTAVGDAQIDTAVQIDGLNTLLLDGTGDEVTSTGFDTLPDAWTIEFKVRLASVTPVHDIFSISSTGSAVGVLLRRNAGAGGVMNYYFSASGSSWDVVSGGVGTKNSWAADTTYHFAVTYDPVAGKIYVYVDGVKDYEFATTAKVYLRTKWRLGYYEAGNYTAGAYAGFRFAPFCRYPNGTTFTPPDISTFAVEGDYFSIPEMKMYQGTAASGTAGTNPTMTQKHRVYLGEAVTDASSVTSAITYALKGRFRGPFTTPVPSGGTTMTANHYIGVIPQATRFLFKNVVTQHGYTPGDVVIPVAYGATLPVPIVHATTRLTAKAVSGSTNDLVVDSSGGAASITKANWAYGFEAERGW